MVVCFGLGFFVVGFWCLFVCVWVLLGLGFFACVVVLVCSMLLIFIIFCSAFITDKTFRAFNLTLHFEILGVFGGLEFFVWFLLLCLLSALVRKLTVCIIFASS